MNGVDLATVKELLGHKSMDMTLRYAHLSKPHKKKAVDTLGRVLDGHFLDTQPKMAITVDFTGVRKGLKSEEKVWHARQDSNLRPADSKSDALSS